MENLPLSPKVFEEKIGYRYNDINLLINALTHSSYANECKPKGEAVEYNERLEFLGDSVLSIIVSDYLFKTRYFILFYGKNQMGAVKKWFQEICDVGFAGTFCWVCQNHLSARFYSSAEWEIRPTYLSIGVLFGFGFLPLSPFTSARRRLTQIRY